MKKKSHNKFGLIVAISTPILSIVSFVLTYFLDPLKYESQNYLATIPAFFLSIIILIIGHLIVIFEKSSKNDDDIEQIYDAVKSYLHIIRLGTPKKAWQYVMHRLPVLDYVQNTSFDFEDETEQSYERLYDDVIYSNSLVRIANYIKKGLMWKDIGDSTALSRFQNINKSVKDIGPCDGKYNYKLINHTVPQMNFIILTYKDGTTEVLFNWDFRYIPKDPVVLLSQNQEIFNMFAAQFKGLWKVAVEDYDSL